MLKTRTIKGKYKKLKERMANEGITQASLAKSVNLKPCTLNLKLNGGRPMLLSEAEKIAEVLNITDAEFGLYFLSESCVEQ